MTTINLKRIYDEPESADGARVLVDRIWPRGVSKERAQLTAWLKDIAPTPELRKWFDHKPERFKLFEEKYLDELKSNDYAVKQLQEVANENISVTLLYAAKDQKHNHAIVLKHFLEQKRER